ncbi:MAG: hypothetical protein AAF677_04465 [Pseudomonadota bacterium]
MTAVDILRLKGPFTDEQAEALARIFDQELATKAHVTAERETLRQELQVEIEKVRGEIEKVRGEMARLDGNVSARLAETKAEIVRWLLGSTVATVGLIGVLIRVLG